METNLEQYVRIREEKDMLEAKLKEAKKPFLEEIDMIEEQMRESIGDLLAIIESRDSHIKRLNGEILETWDNNGPATIELTDGVKVVRSTIKSIGEVNTRGVLEKLLPIIKDDTKLPFTIKWTDKAIIPLLDANVIPAEFATINTTYRLAIRKPKD